MPRTRKLGVSRGRPNTRTQTQSFDLNRETGNFDHFESREDIRQQSSFNAHNINTIFSDEGEMPSLHMFGESCQSSRLPAINIVPFSGKPDMLEYFVTQLKEMQYFFKWDDRYLLIMAKSKLVDKAQTYISQVAETRQIKSSEELFQLLRTFFKVKPVGALISELDNLKMLPAENIQNLAHRIDILASKVYKNTPLEELNKLKFVKFIALIPPEIRIFVLQHIQFRLRYCC